MKIYKLDQLLDSTPDRQYSLGNGAVRLIYGTLSPREKARAIPAPDGFVQIVHVIKGTAGFRHGNTTFSASAGEAFVATEPVYIENSGDGEVLYIAACGRSSSGGTGAAGGEVEAGERSLKDKETGPHSEEEESY